MRKPRVIGGLIVTAQILGSAIAVAGPWEDGMAAYNRGDYMPAIRLFRSLAEAGNAEAQHLIGAMYRASQARIGRCIEYHDGGGTLAGARDGAGLRGVELPELRVLKSWRHSGARRARTRNLEIARCAIAHLRSGPLDHPGMTLRNLLGNRFIEVVPPRICRFNQLDLPGPLPLL